MYLGDFSPYDFLGKASHFFFQSNTFNNMSSCTTPGCTLKMWHIGNCIPARVWSVSRTLRQNPCESWDAFNIYGSPHNANNKRKQDVLSLATVATRKKAAHVNLCVESKLARVKSKWISLRGHWGHRFSTALEFKSLNRSVEHGEPTSDAKYLWTGEMSNNKVYSGSRALRNRNIKKPSVRFPGLGLRNGRFGAIYLRGIM